MPLPAQILGRYRVDGRIATGALGTVLAAVDERTGRDVAIKLFDGAEDNHATWVDELRLAARLEHPHIAVCLDAGEDRASGFQVLVFARALGGSLRRALVRGLQFDDEAILRLLAEVAAGLAHAHAQRVIHRDVKPENILALERMGAPPWALTDFGAGRFLSRGTMANTLVGSRLYMAPEVFMREADAACDQYSLGIVGVELLAGELPGGDLRGRFLHAHRWNPGLRGVIARMIDPNPRRRFVDVDALLRALRRDPPVLPPQTELADGRRLTIEESKLRVYPGDPGDARDGFSVRGRIGREPRFVSVDGDDAAMIVGGRRLTTSDGDALTTLLASDRRLDVLGASLEHRVAWLRDGDALAVCELPFGSPHARAKLPPRILAALAGSPRTFGAPLSPTQAIFAWPGEKELLLCEVRGPRIAATLHRLPWPLYRVARRRGRIFAIFGDHQRSTLLALDGDGYRPLASAELGADAVEIVWGGGGAALRSLIPSFSTILCESDTIDADGQGAVAR
jgi:hypothetical protein